MPSWGKKNSGVGWLHPISFITWIQKITNPFRPNEDSFKKNVPPTITSRRQSVHPSWGTDMFFSSQNAVESMINSETSNSGICYFRWGYTFIMNFACHLLISAFIQKSSSHSSHHLPTLSCWCLWLIELENPGIPESCLVGRGHLGCFGVCSHTLSSWLILISIWVLSSFLTSRVV